MDETPFRVPTQDKGMHQIEKKGNPLVQSACVVSQLLAWTRHDHRRLKYRQAWQGRRSDRFWKKASLRVRTWYLSPSRRTQKWEYVRNWGKKQIYRRRTKGVMHIPSFLPLLGSISNLTQLISFNIVFNSSPHLTTSNLTPLPHPSPSPPCSIFDFRLYNSSQIPPPFPNMFFHIRRTNRTEKKKSKESNSEIHSPTQV